MFTDAENGFAAGLLDCIEGLTCYPGDDTTPEFQDAYKRAWEWVKWNEPE